MSIAVPECACACARHVFVFGILEIDIIIQKVLSESIDIYVEKMECNITK